MTPRCLIERCRSCVVALCVAACSAAPAAREGPNRAPPLLTVSTEAATAPVDPPLGDAGAAACEPFDMRNPACRGDPRACLEGLADCKCPSPPDVENPACWGTMPCPRVPDRRVRACWPRLPACPDVDHPDPDNPNCPASSVTGRVIKVEATGGDTLVTVGVGTAQGIAASWRATLLRGDSDDALLGGEVTILRVTARLTVGRAHMTVDALQANLRVRFERR